MRLDIHNVGHGACITLRHDNGNVMMWDCGHTEQNRPSQFLPRKGIDQIEHFFVTNYDQDHISDLPDLRQNIAIGLLHHNPSITRDQLQDLKRQSGPLSLAMRSMLEMLNVYNAAPSGEEPAFPGVTFNVYWNDYLTDFPDTNNISLVTIIDVRGTKFIIPGDVEKPGWERLLQNQAFRNDLAGVNVFVASHHGRENGYCSDLFDLCTPDVFVFSDSPIEYATQVMTDRYSTHATGVQFNGRTRFVLTTRSDGEFGWDL